MKKNIGKTALKILVSTGLFYVILNQVSLETLRQNFYKLDPKFLILVFLLIVLNYVVSTYRWKKLLVHIGTGHITSAYLFGLYFIGSFFNNFMPTSVGGDVYKVYALGKKINSKTDAFAATFMERFTGVVALILISYVGMVKTLPQIVSLLPNFIKDSSVYVGLFEFFLFSGVWILLGIGIVIFDKLSSRIDLLKRIKVSFLQYKERKDALAIAFLSSFLVQFISIFTQYFIFRALGVSIPFWYGLFTFPVIGLMGFFIPSLNGLGVQDALYMQLFTYVGVAPEISLSVSIVYHLIRLLVSLVGGILYATGKYD